MDDQPLHRLKQPFEPESKPYVSQRHKRKRENEPRKLETPLLGKKEDKPEEIITMQDVQEDPLEPPHSVLLAVQQRIASMPNSLNFLTIFQEEDRHKHKERNQTQNNYCHHHRNLNSKDLL